jgi:2,3-bisphosphoglycerate-independent phosphoglycerate mutase
LDYDRVLKGLTLASDAKILFLVADGLGGLSHPETGRTEMETARLPNLDALAARSTCGLHDPVLPGITPGSGPGHLGIFGYDPTTTRVGRGVLAAYGIGFRLEPGDVAARINFCTLDEEGRVTDRRAGRISTEENRKRAAILSDIRIEGVDLFVRTVKEHRAVLVLRGEGLDGALADTDPQQTGVPPRAVKPLRDAAEKTASLVNRFVAEARQRLDAQAPANGILLRGFDSPTVIPGFGERYGLRAAAIAAYPMYRGLAFMVGMTVVETGETFESQIETLEKILGQYDFFFLHYKPTDSRGEDGDFDAKVRALETLDSHLPRILDLGFDVIVVSGDHSTPSVLRSHSWHPVPFLIHSNWCIAGATDSFTERNAAAGMEGRIPACCLIPLALAHARRLEKYGA